MKTIIAFLALICVAQISLSQNSCSKFYPFTKGAVSELSMYNHKDKPQGKVAYQVVEVNDNGSTVQANMNTILYDKNGKEISNSNYDATCSNGVVSIDFNSLMNQNMMKTYSNMDMDAEVTGTNLEIPNDISVGDKLPDANINVAMKMAGMNMNMATNIINREVIGMETVETPAGTFECYVLTQTMSMKSMGTNMQLTSKNWIAEGVGVVKTESYKKNGKLDSKSVLTKFEK